MKSKKAIKKAKHSSAVRDDLFIVHKAVKAAGLSRTSIVKLERAGFIQPKKVNKKTGYRYFDIFNVYKLVQYRAMRLMGMTQQEIYGYFSDDADRSEEILEQMQVRLRLLQRGYEEFALRTAREKNDSFSFVDMDEMTCLTAEGEFSSLKEMEVAALNLSVEVVERRFGSLATEMMFGEWYDVQTERSDDAERLYHVKVCVPIEPKIPVEAERTGVEVFPACRMFSILHYGSYEDVAAFDEARNRLWKEIEARGLKPVGAMRNIGVVAPYVGGSIDRKEDVFRLAVPVEE